MSDEIKHECGTGFYPTPQAFQLFSATIWHSYVRLKQAVPADGKSNTTVARMGAGVAAVKA